MAKVIPTSRSPWMGSNENGVGERHGLGDGPERHTWVMEQDAVDARPTRQRTGSRTKGKQG
jgi:hypothetical protein